MKRVFSAALAAVSCAGVLAAGAASAAPSAAAKPVECTGTLTGSYGAIVVPDGATCVLDGATTGAVTVGAGASLDTMNAIIDGNLMSRDAASLRMIDTDVYGNAMVRGTTGRVSIGGKHCQVDPAVTGNLMLDDNLGNVAVCDLTVGHNLEVKNTVGRIGVFGNTVGNNMLMFNNTGLANRVRDNVVDNGLDCKGNTGKVLSSGNTAAKLMGQCTA